MDLKESCVTSNIEVSPKVRSYVCKHLQCSDPLMIWAEAVLGSVSIQGMHIESSFD